MPDPAPTAGEVWYGKAQWSILQRTDYAYTYANDVIVRYTDIYDTRDLESIVAYVRSLTNLSSLTASGNVIAGTWDTLLVDCQPINPNQPNGAVRLTHALQPSSNQAETSTSTEWENTRKIIGIEKRNQLSKETEPVAAVAGEVVSVDNTVDDKTGRYVTKKTRDVAIKQSLLVDMIDVDGPYHIYFWENFTLTEINDAIQTLPITAKVSVSTSVSRYPERYSMTVTVRDVNNVGSVETIVKYHHQGLHEFMVRKVDGLGGRVYVDTYMLTYNIRHGTGLATARTDYAALLPVVEWGSFFEDHGRNWYTYKAVTKVERIKRTDVTSTWNSTGSVDLTTDKVVPT